MTVIVGKDGNVLVGSAIFLCLKAYGFHGSSNGSCRESASMESSGVEFSQQVTGRVCLGIVDVFRHANKCQQGLSDIVWHQIRQVVIADHLAFLLV